ncbi:hypothetical protein L6164_022249 [Bauhinia variegata]|uniref:Uncharacterized protein n=1 Tax=Bauhinia variegata TaxID=167791 RepID=A0ACB9MFZ8_BAUVA|nr:hypothetical protein L6164_022249 [Bauhinia variegata]
MTCKKSKERVDFRMDDVNRKIINGKLVIMNKNQDVVYGRLQCNGDVSSQYCEACGEIAAKEIRELCPNQKEASLLDQDCSLQYSYQPLSSEADIGTVIYLWNVQNASDPVLFTHQLGNLLKNLSSYASSSSSKLATGSTEYTDLEDIYAMAQCRRDSEESSCLTCLQKITSLIPSCCGGKVGGQVISTGCNLRYETYTFFSSPPASPPPESTSSPPSQLPERNLTSAETTNSTSHSGNVILFQYVYEFHQTQATLLKPIIARR